MSDELFDGNVASTITLGEALVRGILTPPKYITALYSYQKDLEKYQRLVLHAKNKIARDKSNTYLEALRRALEKADGLDVVFQKHIADPAGRYIVFCANKEHMDEMVDKVPDWFGKIDPMHCLNCRGFVVKGIRIVFICGGFYYKDYLLICIESHFLFAPIKFFYFFFIKIYLTIIYKSLIRPTISFIYI